MCLAVSAIGLGAAGQFASRVTLVEVYATVVDERGHPVEGLPQDAFVVEEDGRPQEVRAFASGDEPLSLAVAVDRSFSMSRERLTRVVYATQRMLGELRPADRVMMLAIGSEVEVLSPLSNDHRAAYDAVANLQPWGTTPLFDATRSAIAAIQNTSGRRALVLITDGAERYSAATAAEIVAFARTHDVLVYPVTLSRGGVPVLSELAAVTGARAEVVPDINRLPSVLSSIAGELRQQYLLGYEPSPRAGADGEAWRRIAVRVTRPGLRVRARAGYVPSR